MYTDTNFLANKHHGWYVSLACFVHGLITLIVSAARGVNYQRDEAEHKGCERNIPTGFFICQKFFNVFHYLASFSFFSSFRENTACNIVIAPELAITTAVIMVPAGRAFSYHVRTVTV